MADLSFDPKDLSQVELHHYLLSAVAPRPICFASTVDATGRVNLSPFSFFNVFSSNPPVMIFSPSRRGRDNTTKHTLENVLAVPEVVINIVNHPIVEQMSLSSTEYAEGVNEFVKAGLTQRPSVQVQPPRVGEAPVAFECRVTEVKALGDGPGAGNLVFAEVVHVHVREEYLDENRQLDTPRLDLVARMGGSWYGRMSPEALFEIPKPLQRQGIGVDQLPASARNSTVLTGNNLGRLGNQERLPNAAEIEDSQRTASVQSALAKHTTREARLKAMHHEVQALLEAGQDREALALVFAGDVFFHK
ncbi:NADH-FMN oxidoreductase RutF, flavin reductase (DIM6/NTAB) family [Reichenbachiella agariperforans]|uniref:NADH-FMN oxidoreductase RutF, flavin reductase (DIM6/NTAB) family n=1 Tax=Reichenbachiella agariperforans TaxID=156994 RepID=A0A1M6VEN1_REIAG|nr:flavin reductase family protein [Reichenbachiella agariperforans]SHK79908.1 NADH-FMN oxidoreductase RutF, flavin reductase (DIM6/NTAB) family [Reichenbachiella agariperforans]